MNRSFVNDYDHDQIRLVQQQEQRAARQNRLATLQTTPSSSSLSFSCSPPRLSSHHAPVLVIILPFHFTYFCRVSIFILCLLAVLFKDKRTPGMMWYR